MDLTLIQSLFRDNKVFWATHATTRMQERDIYYEDIECCILSGEIIEDYPDDYPYPSCLIFGYDSHKKVIHTVVGTDGKTLYIITVYYPTMDKFKSDLRTRKDT